MSSIDVWQTQALERHCNHCSRERQGRVYLGRDYLRALQCMKGEEAERLAHKVGPFFWSDADMMHVRLCDDCAARLCMGAPIISPATSAASFH